MILTAPRACVTLATICFVDSVIEFAGSFADLINSLYDAWRVTTGGFFGRRPVPRQPTGVPVLGCGVYVREQAEA
jgi:hypothetical protein